MATAPTQEKVEDPGTTRNRAKTESYDVFKDAGGTGGFERVNEWDKPVEVTARGEDERRKLAVSLATADWPEEDKSGTFATVLSGQFVTMTRKRKVEPVDEWEV
jgi:hypothetical protein